MGTAWTPDSVPLVPEPAPAPAPEPKPVVPPPPVPVVVPGLYTVEKVQQTISLIAAFADTATHLIPGEVDDKIVGVLKLVATQPWLAPLLTTLLNMSQGQREQVLKSMAPGFNASSHDEKIAYGWVGEKE